MHRLFLAAVVAAALTVGVAPGPASAQSFDCAKSGTAVEKQICGDPNLSRMDSELGAVYGKLRQSLSGSDEAELQSTERRWQRRRNACDTATNCVTEAYARRLRALSRDYDVFPGWTADFTSTADLSLDVSHDGDRSYTLALSGAGQNWTCDGTIKASLSRSGHALVVPRQGGDPVRIPAAGTGLWVPQAFQAVINADGLCGANAPSVPGFFARTAAASGGGGDTAQGAPASGGGSLGFAQKPFIHPQIIYEMATWLSDNDDQVVAINLEAAQDGNRFAGDFKVEPASTAGAAPMVSMTDGTNAFAYRYIGTMTNGITVLETVQSSTDGTGAFPSLMLLSFGKGHGIAVNWDAGTIDEGPSRVLLIKHGEITIGANRTGELKVEGNRIFVGPNQSDAPPSGADDSGWLTYQAGAPAQ